MIFNSQEYFLFLPLVYLVFYFIGQRARWAVLLVASFLFYAAIDVPYLLVVLMLVTIMTYGFGRAMGRISTPKVKLFLLWSGVATNVIILVVMKYLSFSSSILKTLPMFFSGNTQIQPCKIFIVIGVSFYVFQAISYLIDIHLGIVKPERHFGYFALYMAFFSKLLQGPIERAGNLLPQLKVKYEFNYNNMRFGILLFTWGLVKKVVIADRLGLYVDTVYNNVSGFTGLPLPLSTYAYAFQVYMDFSGYTDMALGSARFFNINLTQNFNRPYISTTVADFWRRWHISFSSWILDYIFKPLQMYWRNWKNWGTAIALMITFLVSGVWHGASWGFVIWGFLHGLYLACSVFYRPYQRKLHKALGVEKTWFLKGWQIFVTFNLVSFAWIFFRANSIYEAKYVIANIFNGWKGTWSEFLLSQGRFTLALTVGAVLAFNLLKIFLFAKEDLYELSRKNRLTRYFFYNALILMLIFLAKNGLSGKFIYLRF